MQTLILLESKFTKMIEDINKTMNGIIKENNSKFDTYCETKIRLVNLKETVLLPEYLRVITSPGRRPSIMEPSRRYGRARSTAKEKRKPTPLQTL